MSLPAADDSTWAERWNRFWFTPVDPAPVGLLRGLTGLAVVLYLAAWSPRLTVWFGPTGLLPGDVVAELTGAPWWQRSYFFLLHTPAALWTAHGIGLAVACAMMFGWRSRFATPLTLLVVLAFIHRVPLVVGLFESVLVLLLLYLSLAPSGAAFSVDAWRRRRRGGSFPRTSWSANVVLRLIQIHLAALVLLMATTKLAGDVWWDGMALWWLAARTETRLVDLTFLHQPPGFYLINLWTHLIVAIELAFPVLVWFRATRGLACWLLFGELLSLVLVTGNLPLTLLFGVALLAFMPPGLPRAWWERLACRAAPALPQSD